MDMLTHFITGSAVYLTFFEDANFMYFIIGAVVLDIDHVFGYFYKAWRKSWSHHQQALTRLRRWMFFPRTALHSIWGSILLSLIVYAMTHSISLTMSFFLGTFIHLIIDSLDISGIRWFWPYMHISWYMPISFSQEHGKLSTKSNLKYGFYLSLFSSLLIIIFLIKKDLRSVFKIW